MSDKEKLALRDKEIRHLKGQCNELTLKVKEKNKEMDLMQEKADKKLEDSLQVYIMDFNNNMREVIEEKNEIEKQLNELKKIYIGQLPRGVSDTFVEKLVKTCGNIDGFTRTRSVSGEPARYAFVEFE